MSLLQYFLHKLPYISPQDSFCPNEKSFSSCERPLLYPLSAQILKEEAYIYKNKALLTRHLRSFFQNRKEKQGPLPHVGRTFLGAGCFPVAKDTTTGRTGAVAMYACADHRPSRHPHGTLRAQQGDWCLPSVTNGGRAPARSGRGGRPN